MQIYPRISYSTFLENYHEETYETLHLESPKFCFTFFRVFFIWILVVLFLFDGGFFFCPFLFFLSSWCFDFCFFSQAFRIPIPSEVSSIRTERFSLSTKYVTIAWLLIHLNLYCPATANQRNIVSLFGRR